MRYKYISHKALAENLTAGTTYSWRVGYAGHWSDIAQFRTEDENQGEYSFLVMSDSHIMNKTYVDEARRCALAAVKTVPEARFCWFTNEGIEQGEVQIVAKANAKASDFAGSGVSITYSFVYGNVLFLVFSMQDFWRESYDQLYKTWSVYLTDHVSYWFRKKTNANPDTKYRVSLAHFNLFSGSFVQKMYVADLQGV